MKRDKELHFRCRLAFGGLLALIRGKNLAKDGLQGRRRGSLARFAARALVRAADALFLLSGDFLNDFLEN